MNQSQKERGCTNIEDGKRPVTNCGDDAKIDHERVSRGKSDLAHSPTVLMLAVGLHDLSLFIIPQTNLVVQASTENKLSVRRKHDKGHLALKGRRQGARKASVALGVGGCLGITGGLSSPKRDFTHEPVAVSNILTIPSYEDDTISDPSRLK
mmetsp:Transcript_11982/g.50033  ORF Transcript_11982/g.50033 Transcript_11982/m.50033 type:complete len:152 (-) Transcript_11982:602-1057(-)